jgi:protein-S-isoprenylcysteine O-methyltransferase Ste14
MRFDNIFARDGKWLFRWRSYLPLLVLGIIVAALFGLKASDYDDGALGFEDVWEVVCLGVSFIGFGIRIFTIGHVGAGTSGRNTREQRADELNTSGIYSLVRHPLYLGNFFIWLGISMFLRLWWLSLIFILVFWLFYERIIYVEEEYLRKKFGKTWENWAAGTPIFVPKLKGYVKSALPFSIRNVLAKENHVFLNIILAFTSIELLEGLITEHRLGLDLMWIIILACALFIWIILRILKKKTKLLAVEGR